VKVAIVHDWLTGMRGGEKVLEVLCELFPQAKLFTLVHNKGSLSKCIEDMDISTSFIQKLPGKSRHYRQYLPLFPIAIEQFCMDDFDLVISSSHCVAKGVLVRPGTCHICYCYTPMRYIWDQYFIYFGNGKLTGVKKILIPYIAHKLRIWDVVSSNRVDYFVGISQHVVNRVRSIYKRDAKLIPPPVDVSRFRIAKKGSDSFLVVSALVPYKRIELAVSAFNRLGYPLLVVGTGPEEKMLKKMANPNIRFLGHCSDEELVELYASCKAFIFPGEEDFGITVVEAQASGVPVIAYGKGGALETVKEGKSGLFFYEATVESLIEAVKKFDTMFFDPVIIRELALLYDRSVFKSSVEDFIIEKYKEFHKGGVRYVKEV